METKFQTSFIPKKPLTAPAISSRSGGVSIFMVLAVLIFIVSLGGAGFAFAWKNHLVESQATSKKDLESRTNAFNITTIEQFKRMSTKIDTAKSVLAKHLAISDIFDIVSKLTAVEVRFNSLDFEVPPSDKDGLRITMRGVGSSFKAVAFQASVFGNSSKYGRNTVLKDPVISDLSVDQFGRVSFLFTATLDPSQFAYTKVLQTHLQQESAQAAADASGSDSQQ